MLVAPPLSLVVTKISLGILYVSWGAKLLQVENLWARGVWIYLPYSCGDRAVILRLQSVPEMQIFGLKNLHLAFPSESLWEPFLLWPHQGPWPWPLQLLMTSWWRSNPWCIQDCSREGCKLFQEPTWPGIAFSYRNTDVNGGLVPCSRRMAVPRMYPLLMGKWGFI